MGKYNNLEEMIEGVEELKAGCLFDAADIAGFLPPVAEQHFQAAICLLEQTVIALRLADYARMRGE